MEKVDIIEIFKGTFNEECLRYTRTPFRWNGKNFIETLNDKLIGYQIIVSKFFSALKVCTQYQDYLTYKLKINIICDKLILCIQEYFKGLPHRAYNEFDTMIKETFDEKIKFLDCFLPWLGDTKFYRTVAIFDGRSYNRERCFHVPYNMREKVSTSRFSIPGHPSLYLSDNIHLCNIEIGEKKTKLFSKFKVNYEKKWGPNFRIVDLGLQVEDIINIISDNYNEKIALEFIIGYLMRLPIQLACSFIRIDKESSFSIEYVIPQIVMQWIKENSPIETIVGIKYKSCANKLCSKLGNNYVFPTSGLIDKDINYCPLLSQAFILTSPINSSDYNTIDEVEKILDEMELRKI